MEINQGMAVEMGRVRGIVSDWISGLDPVAEIDSIEVQYYGGYGENGVRINFAGPGVHELVVDVRIYETNWNQIVAGDIATRIARSFSHCVMSEAVAVGIDFREDQCQVDSNHLSAILDEWLTAVRAAERAREENRGSRFWVWRDDSGMVIGGSILAEKTESTPHGVYHAKPVSAEEFNRLTKEMRVRED